MTRLSFLALFLVVTPCSAADPSFRSDVAPVLANRCLSCHSGQKAKGGYKAHTFADLVTPGKSGESPVVSGKPYDSELLQRLVDPDPARRMPPADAPLSQDEIAAIRRWIAAGAKFDGPDKAAAIKTYLPARNHPPAPEKYPVAVPVHALAFAPSENEIAVGGVHEVTIWNASTGTLIRRISGLPARIQSLAFSPDGTQLLVGGGTPGEYGEATLLSLADSTKRKALGVFEDIVLTVAFSADGKVAVAGGADRSTRTFKIDDGRELWRSSFHSDWITAAAFMPDGRFVATASRDRTVKVLDAATGKLFTTYNGHRRQYGSHTGQFEVYGVGFDAAGVAYSAGGGDAVRVWEPVKAQEENGSASDMEERFSKAGHTRYLEYSAIRPVYALTVVGGQVFTAAGDGKVRQHDPGTSKLVREFTGPVEWLYSITANAKVGRVAAGGFDGMVWVWDTRTGELVTKFLAAPGLKR